MSTTLEVKEFLDRAQHYAFNARAQSTVLKETLAIDTKVLREKMAELEDLKQAQRILSEALKMTYWEFKTQSEKLVTAAFGDVFKQRSFKFLVTIDASSSKSRPTIKFEVEEEGDPELYDPEKDKGGGFLDVLSLALRIAMWAFQEEKTRPTLLLDEPMKFAGSLIEDVVEFIIRINKLLGIQFIIITHMSEMAQMGDTSYLLEHNGKHTIVTNISRQEH